MLIAIDSDLLVEAAVERVACDSGRKSGNKRVRGYVQQTGVNLGQLSQTCVSGMT